MDVEQDMHQLGNSGIHKMNQKFSYLFLIPRYKTLCALQYLTQNMKRKPTTTIITIGILNSF